MMATELVKLRAARASGVMRGSSGVLQASVMTLIAVAGSQRVASAHRTSSIFDGSTSSSTMITKRR